MSEIWKDVPGWEGFYEASSYGRLRSATRTIVQKSRWGSEQSYIIHGRILKLSPDKDGYLRCTFRNQSKAQSVAAHRTVCLAFHGAPPSPDMEAAHGDGVRSNNASENLRWATTKQNFDDRYSHGTAPVGEGHGRSLLRESDVISIRARRRNGESLASIAKDFPAKVGAIQAAATGRTWRHLA